MTPRRRILMVTGLVLSGAFALYGTAAGDPVGLSGLFNSRGTIEPFHIHDHASHVHLKAGARVDVAIVGAQIDASGQTGWHTHPAESIVSVQPGGAPLTMVTQQRGRCLTRTYQPGQAFVHRAGPHNFRNDTSGTLRFGVAYFVPVGATLLTPTTAPEACA